MSIELLRSKLHGIKKTSTGWIAKCPAHDDNNPSLSISEGDTQPIILKCHAGCNSESILKAVGLEWADISNDDYDIDAPQNGDIYSNYYAPSGQLVYRSVRKTPKGFYQQSVEPDGEWANSMQGITRYLYHANDLPKSTDTVYICEGEKDCDRLRSIGLTATTNPGGAGKWLAEFNEKLVDRDVVILPHNDDPGFNHANKVKSSIKNVVKSVEILVLPDLPDGGGDVSDWLNNGGDKDKLLELVHSQTTAHIKAPKILCMADVTPRDVEWLWPQRIPFGAITIISGDPKLGKSFISLDILSRLSTGRAWPDDPSSRPEIASGILMTAEDSVSRVLSKRLIAQQADMSKCFVYRSNTQNGKDELVTDLKENIDQLEQYITQIHNCRLIVIDPITAYLGDTKSGNDNVHVRSMLHPLSVLAEKYNLAIIGITHLSKAVGANAMHRVHGSIAWGAAARVVLERYQRSGQQRAASDASSGQQLCHRTGNGASLFVY